MCDLRFNKNDWDEGEPEYRPRNGQHRDAHVEEHSVWDEASR